MEHPKGSDIVKSKGQKRTEGLKNDPGDYYSPVTNSKVIGQNSQPTKRMSSDKFFPESHA